jgi:mRNA interferase RelE/StbE
VNVRVSDHAWRALRKLEAKQGLTVLQAVMGLGDNPMPTGSKKMVDQPGYRLRVGNFRVLYHLDGDQVTIDDIGDRKEIY